MPSLEAIQTARREIERARAAKRAASESGDSCAFFLAADQLDAAILRHRAAYERHERSR